ncbi:ABC transporter substrate-binding protein [Pigmentiphaga litoralis]|uniref:transporter substrate-binding domain-containing protein n=1 Tax=Pigmentiphaga litoralis TaxID=516702 RepID=UPI00167880BD|nr:transporter substrate-binding domain-containing protein [Pigmentiphaga litoralis]GGX21374.1 ABC transporter substrate-binding protein [Pigmentiphaga litoralis]
MKRHLFVAGLVGAVLAGCGQSPVGSGANSVPVGAVSAAGPAASSLAGERASLAPTGALRVGVYRGSPTSMLVDGAGQRTGVSYELGQLLGQRLQVPVQVVEYSRVAEVIDGLKANQVDFTVTNASAARAQIVDFSKPLISLELGYLVPALSPVQTVADVDRSGVRVGVTEGSSSQGVLGRQFRAAKVVPVPSLKVAADMLQAGQLDAFATNKAILNELADTVPGARILEGRWGLEHMAIAIPKGREGSLPQLDTFAQQLQKDGTLAAVIRRAGLRGTAAP